MDGNGNLCGGRFIEHRFALLKLATFNIIIFGESRKYDRAPWSWPISDLCTFGNMEALISRGFLRCFLWVWRSSGPQGLRGLPQGLTSGPHFYLRASPAQKLPIILDQGPPRFLGGPEVNFPNQWMDTVDKIRVKSAQWTNISMVANKKKKNKLQ